MASKPMVHGIVFSVLKASSFYSPHKQGGKLRQTENFNGGEVEAQS